MPGGAERSNPIRTLYDAARAGMGYLGAALAVSVSNGVQLSGLIVCCVVGKVRPARAAWAPALRPTARSPLQ